MRKHTPAEQAVIDAAKDLVALTSVQPMGRRETRIVHNKLVLRLRTSFDVALIDLEREHRAAGRRADKEGSE